MGGLREGGGWRNKICGENLRRSFGWRKFGFFLDGVGVGVRGVRFGPMVGGLFLGRCKLFPWSDGLLGIGLCRVSFRSFCDRLLCRLGTLGGILEG